MKNKTIAILESRSGEQLADIVRKYGGTPFLAPALAELPDIDPDHITELIDSWAATPPDIFIFQTGVGTKALFATTEQLQLTQKLLQQLEKSLVVVRGPKPSGTLRGNKVRIDLSAEDPFTTQEIMKALQNTDLNGKNVVVQRYGNTNFELQEALLAKGAKITEIATYRWAMPDTKPLLDLMDALDKDAIDMVCFTSASQVENLFTLANSVDRANKLLASINRTQIASIGPVCSKALSKAGVHIDIEASPPKLGPFVTAINDRFA